MFHNLYLDVLYATNVSSEHVHGAYTGTYTRIIRRIAVGISKIYKRNISKPEFYLNFWTSNSLPMVLKTYGYMNLKCYICKQYK